MLAVVKSKISYICKIYIYNELLISVCWMIYQGGWKTLLTKNHLNNLSQL